MDCNKDEAARAKALAARKMLDKDFAGAIEVIIKDFAALLLHPDKNKFGGAEAAFKLVGEANENLTERVRATQTSFWTLCPSCRTRYEYPISALEKVLHCLNNKCLKQFVARQRAVDESGISETSTDNEEEMVESRECSISETSSGNEEQMVESSESSIPDSEEDIAENGPAANDTDRGQQSMQMQEVKYHVVGGTEKEGIPEKSLEVDPEALSLEFEEDLPSTAQVVQQYAEIWKNADIPQKSPGPQTNVTATPGVNLNVASHHVGEHSKRETAVNTGGPQDKMKSAHAARNPSKASSRFRATQKSFWTSCPSCRARYEYPIAALEEVVFCQFCSKEFIAHESSTSETSNNESSESNTSESSTDNEEERVVESRECSISETSSGNEEERAVSESNISGTSSDSDEEIADHGPAANDTDQGQQSGQMQENKYHVVSGTEKEGIPENSLELDPEALSLDFEEDLPSTAQVVQQYAEIWKNVDIPQKSPGSQTNVTTPGVNLNVASHHVGEHSKRETAVNTGGPQDKMNFAHASRNPSKASSRVRATQKSFWTSCPSCRARYEYPIAALEEVVFCQFCSKEFIAHESSTSETSNNESSESNTSESSSDNEEERVVESRECSISETSSGNEEERAVSESNISGTSSDSEEEIADHGPTANDSDRGQQSGQMQEDKYYVVIGTEKEGIPEKSLELDPEALSLDFEEDLPSTAQVVQQYAEIRKNADIPQKSPGPQTNVTAQKAWSATPGVNLNVASHHVGEHSKRETAANTAGPQDKMKSAHAARNPSKSSSTAGLKRRRRAVVESSESSISETSSDCEEEVAEHLPASNGSGLCHQTRTSSWQKQEDEYNEEINDDHDVLNDKVDDFVSSPALKRLRKGFMFHGDHSNKATNLNKEIAGHSGLTNGVSICSNTQIKEIGAHAQCGEKSFSKIQQMEREPMHVGENGDDKEKKFHSVRSNVLALNNDGASVEYEFTSVNPEFFYFGQLRDKSKFRTNQIWAVCDDQGCMPRFYARITKVKTMPNFMVHFVWLEFNPTNKVEAAWSFSGLPVACGCFKYGKSDTAKETGMFSRTISYEKSKTRNCIEIYPREGEVWALFKGWDIVWSSDPNNHEYWSHQYEVVEVLSDLTVSSGISVMPLVKIKGYDNLFMQSREAAPYVIPQGDTLKFSHCIPHHVISAIGERVPEGSLELDRASLPVPINLEMAFTSGVPDCSSERSQERDARYAGSSSGNNSRKGSMSVGEGQHTPCMNAGIAAETPNEENNKHNTCFVEVTVVNEDNLCQTIYLRTELKFYCFPQSKLLQKFSPGQIWALYSDVDRFPSYYGFIQRVDLKNGNVQVRFLDVCPHGEEEKRLLQEERTIGCGIFRVSSVDELITYTGTDAFSHCVEASSTGRKGEYEIFPHSGEIWAVYKNWRVGWTAQDFGRCEYELVEILDRTDSSIEVQLLRKVDSYRMVFMPCQAEGSVRTIRKDEYPKFSHQIPNFHLTCEGGGMLRGYLELDPLSLPEEFFNVR